MKATRQHLLGVGLDPMTHEQLTEVIRQAITRGTRLVIAHHNLHSIYVFHHDAKMREFYARADITYVDGMPIVLAGRLRGLPFAREHRVTAVDWVWPLMEAAARERWRIFFVGGQPGIAERGAAVLREQFPSLMIKTHHGYFDREPGGAENAAVLEEVRGFRPDLIIVGMGMPIQEHWVLDNLAGLPAVTTMTWGATMDYLAGNIPTPPRWAGRLGLEWFFRLAAEPRRLGYRYLVEPWFIAGLFARELVLPAKHPRQR